MTAPLPYDSNEKTLIAPINRKLAREGVKLRTLRGERELSDLGRHDIVDSHTSTIVAAHLMPATRAGGTGVSPFVNASVLGVLARDFAKLIAVEVAALIIAPSSHYGTSKAATLPPGKTRAWALRTVKTIPGARKVGRDWVVSVEMFDAWASEQDTKNCGRLGTAVPSRPGVPVSSMALAERAERSLAANGFRPTR